MPKVSCRSDSEHNHKISRRPSAPSPNSLVGRRYLERRSLRFNLLARQRPSHPIIAQRRNFLPRRNLYFSIQLKGKSALDDVVVGLSPMV
jgi:hypothetical protein